MCSEYLEAIPVADVWRVAVSQDCDAECPAVWGGCDCVVCDLGGLWVPRGLHYSHNADEADEIAEAVAYYTGEDLPGVLGEALGKHYARRGWGWALQNVYPGSPYDVHTRFIATSPEWLEPAAVAGLLEQWDRGDVYSLELQRATEGGWETVDSLGGVYGDWEADARRLCDGWAPYGLEDPAPGAGGLACAA